MELWQFLGEMHPRLVQLPLVLLLAGLGFDLTGLIWRSQRAHWTGLALAILGTLGLLFAFICGIYAEIWAGRAGIPQHPIELHEMMANIASWGFVILLAWRLFLKPEQRRRMGVYLGIGLGWYVLLGLTAYLGGLLVFEYGAGVTGARGVSVLTLSDLNTLATRQTDKNLWYSEWMHHIFGWMTLGLSASLLAQAIWPKHAGKFKWIVPTFLLLGGVFLFFFADLDLYVFTDPRQWRDREVQLHKAIAIIMATSGCVGLWRYFTKETREAKADARNVNEGSNSKIVAVLALIGGSLLFTHVHTVAPYANVAAGVYIAHVVMGLTALAVGATRLAQDYVNPRWRRVLAVGFALFMGIESVLLITYNEGLPWFIGYGSYYRWGDKEGDLVSVAPYGPLRAVLRIDPTDGRAVVEVKDRFTKEPVAVAADRPLQLLIGRGYEETAIELTGDMAGMASRFTGQADFLKTAPAVSARLALPVNGRMVMGYFDPWVTPVIAAVPPNELAMYQCPMHEGIRAVEKGKCPLCGMEMVGIRGPRPVGELHDEKYQLEFSAACAAYDFAGSGSPGGPQRVSVAATLQFMPRTTSGATLPLAIVHEQPLHLIVVSEDLSFFDHVHPVREPDGTLKLPYEFPEPGRYVLFADITPQGDRAQVFRYVVEVADEKVNLVSTDAPKVLGILPDAVMSKVVVPMAYPLTPQSSAALERLRDQASESEQVCVQLMPQPRTIYAGLHTELLFRLTDGQGRPVTELKPYLGAMGHCVGISEDTGLYLHSHPEQLLTPTAEDRGGPVIAFHTLFPKAGRYRIWGQFRRAGRAGGGIS